MKKLCGGGVGIVCMQHFDFKDEQKAVFFDKTYCRQNVMWTASGKEAIGLFDPSTEPGLPGMLWGKLYTRSLFEKDEIREALHKYRKIFPNNFFEDIFIFPRLIAAADRVTVISENGYYHRVGNSSISHAKMMNAYHYEQIDALVCNNKYFKNRGLSIYVHKQLQSEFLLCLRIWYMAYHYEADHKKQRQYTNKLKLFYRDYYGMYKNFHKRISKEKIVICLWKRCPCFWSWLLGKVYFHSDSV